MQQHKTHVYLRYVSYVKKINIKNEDSPMKVHSSNKPRITRLIPSYNMQRIILGRFSISLVILSNKERGTLLTLVTHLEHIS